MQKYYDWFRKYWLDFLIFTYLFFIIYSTIVPFNFIGDLRLLPRRISRIDWIPLRGHYQMIPRSDVLANILFFIPLGVLVGLKKILTFYRKYSGKDWFQIFLWGFLASTTVELLQLLTFDRHTSVTDIITNTLGNLLGALLILVLYMNFRTQIKQILFAIFLKKPENLISAIFLGFIILSSAMPFTFQPSLSSLLEQLKLFISQPVSIQLFLRLIPIQILISGGFAYFLFTGIYRYFSQRISGGYLFLLGTGIFLVPVLLEFFQLLLPVRNHSWGDILASQVGIAVGIGFFYGQRGIASAPPDAGNHNHSIHRCRQLNFFKFLGLIYILYLLTLLFQPDPIPFRSYRLADFFSSGTSHNVSAFRLARLNLMMDFNKEVFTFLPAGFILSLCWFSLKNHARPAAYALGSIVLVLVGGYFILNVVMLKSSAIFTFISAVIGTWFGIAGWKIYHFMIGINE